MRPTRTPAGAHLRVRHSGKWVIIDFDRWYIKDATEEQVEWIEKLHQHAANRIWACSPRKIISHGDFKTAWYLTALRKDEEVLLDAMLAVEREDFQAAQSYLSLDS